MEFPGFFPHNHPRAIANGGAWAGVVCVAIFLAAARGQSPTPSASPGAGRAVSDFDRQAEAMSRQALSDMEKSAGTEAKGDKPLPEPAQGYAPGPWKMNIVSETFWIGQHGGGGQSAWDAEWKKHYGGVDDPRPAERKDCVPKGFTPGLNPFYCELPYNDIAGAKTKPEAAMVIPWFKARYVRYGQSVCENQWVQIRSHSGMSCYAQWEDAGPGGTDAWQYVFGNDRPPLSQEKHPAGVGVSPAVRDYLHLRDEDVVSWRFVAYRDIPAGPWGMYGKNNDLLNARGRAGK